MDKVQEKIVPIGVLLGKTVLYEPRSSHSSEPAYLVWKFSSFCGTRIFITVDTTARYSDTSLRQLDHLNTPKSYLFT
jgi:hypothetical protein